MTWIDCFLISWAIVCGAVVGLLTGLMLVAFIVGVGALIKQILHL